MWGNVWGEVWGRCEEGVGGGLGEMWGGVEEGVGGGVVEVWGGVEEGVGGGVGRMRQERRKHHVHNTGYVRGSSVKVYNFLNGSLDRNLNITFVCVFTWEHAQYQYSNMNAILQLIYFIHIDVSTPIRGFHQGRYLHWSPDGVASRLSHT